MRARHDPAWTADGYVSDRWRPVSPVTGRLDAFQWQTPVASLPSDQGATIAPSAFEQTMLAPRPVRPAISEGLAEPPRDVAPVFEPEPQSELKPDSEPAPQPELESKAAEAEPELQPAPAPAPVQAAEPPPEPEVTPPAVQDNLPPPRAATEPVAPVVSPPASPQAVVVQAPNPETAEVSPPAATPVPESAAPTPLFRARSDLDKPAPPVPVIVPIVRAPDDPGVENDEELPRDEFAEQLAPSKQAGGWRGFWARLGG